jgi:hypothetical protein
MSSYVSEERTSSSMGTSSKKLVEASHKLCLLGLLFGSADEENNFL